jgi:hypothetical protein
VSWQEPNDSPPPIARARAAAHPQGGREVRPSARLAADMPAARRIEEAGTVIDETREDDMGPKTLAPIVLFVLLTFACGARAQQSGRSMASSPSPAWNDDSLITIQKTGGEPARPGDVKIEFYGHDAFKITSPVGLTVLTDPWRNDSTGLPKVVPDRVSTHPGRYRSFHSRSFRP